MSTLAKAVELFLAGRLQEAKRACRKVLQARADLVEAHVLLAEIYRQMGDEARSREAIARATQLRPAWTVARVQQAIGDLLIEAGRHEAAEERYRRALELDPSLSDARYNLAGALSAQGRADESIAELQALLKREPRVEDARERLVRLLQDVQRFEELDSACREGMALHPESPQYPQRLGVALWRRGRKEEGLEMFRAAVARAAGDPAGEAYEDARLQEASALLELGRYEEGWKAFHWRHPRTRIRKDYPQLIEDPAAISVLKEPRRLRIVSEQGFGDEIFFLRFAVELRRRGHRLSIVCEPKLATLLATMPELIDSVNAPVESDFTLCSGDLPLASGQGIAPPLVFRVDVARRDAFLARLRRFGPPPYIGVTWRSGVLPDESKPQRGSYLMKNVPAELLGGALRSIDARVIVLQRRPAAEDARIFEQALDREALDLSALNDQLPDALALLSVLDEYVGVSNTNTHLRAGLPGWGARVLVRTPPEWRWAGSGPATPWFPGFTVYRQERGRDWEQVLQTLTKELAMIYGASQQN